MSHHQHHQHHHNHPPSGGKTILQLEQDILLSNQLVAERNRGFFQAKQITAINLVSSPGSGKTTLLEKTLERGISKMEFFVIEGDQQTSNDANRIAQYNIPGGSGKYRQKLPLRCRNDQ